MGVAGKYGREVEVARPISLEAQSVGLCASLCCALSGCGGACTERTVDECEMQEGARPRSTEGKYLTVGVSLAKQLCRHSQVFAGSDDDGVNLRIIHHLLPLELCLAFGFLTALML